ncbi:MAG: cytochrome C [Candidatus Zixiibacteriota bacterium]|nr:MAG: cytochrome C [candidate division Zixibacteria bacterium]
MKNFLKFIIFILIPIGIVFLMVFTFQDTEEFVKSTNEIKLEKQDMPADHQKFEVLQQEFTSPQQVTEACLSCHNTRGEEIMKTVHWRWLQKDTLMHRGIMDLGKKNVLNNFCIGIESNEALCQTCHIGYGWKDKSFDFNDSKNIDCLICHDNSGEYKKQKGKAGNPPEGLNLSHIAQNIGYPQNKNCGFCHFKGGGGNNVKHGDLEQGLIGCTRDVDVHMNKENNMNCTDCHTTENHNIKGNLYTVAANDNNRITCVQCHSSKPHKDKLLNSHFTKVSCQACHIPTYAKLAPTKTYWDWSTAGKLKNGKPYEEVQDEFHKYDSKHGTAVFGKDLQPEYVWFSGQSDHFLIDDTIKSDTIELNPLKCSCTNHKSKIYPVKVMRGKQIYDTENKTLIQPKLFGPKGSGAFWADFDWNASAQKGMEYIGQDYSGHYGFINTKSYWLINHMVSPAKDALTCNECHNSNGRLKDLTGFYLPGRDQNHFLDWFGIFSILGAFLGIFIHSILRIKGSKSN